VFIFFFLRAAVSAVVALPSSQHSVVRDTAVLEIKYVCICSERKKNELAVYDAFYYARLCYSACMLSQVRLSVCPSVRPSVTRVDQ